MSSNLGLLAKKHETEVADDVCGFIAELKLEELNFLAERCAKDAHFLLLLSHIYLCRLCGMKLVEATTNEVGVTLSASQGEELLAKWKLFAETLQWD